jgi:hypothetical protein
MSVQIEDLVKIHDSKQFEIKLGYFLDKEKSVTDYKVNLYFFIPENLGTTPFSYNKYHFYEDLLSYVRIMPISMTFEELNKEFENFINNKDLWIEDGLLNRKTIKYEVKIYCNIFRMGIKKFSYQIKKSEISDEQILKDISEILKFRKLLFDFKSDILEINSEEECILIDYADEYTSFLVEGYFVRLADKFGNNLGEKILNQLKDAAYEENIYRRDNYKSTISEDNKSNERVIYRYTVLKKYFHKVLSISTDRKEAKAVKNLLYAFAAGVAMIFATTVTFITQRKYGNFTMSFFVALVISYMFKDRIKDFFKFYFSSVFKNKLFDYKMFLKDMEHSIKFGLLKERVDYIDTDDVPEDVIELRVKNTDPKLTNWNSGEIIIKYEKKIRLLNKVINKHFENKISAVKDVMIFNISRILNKAEDPQTKVYLLDENKNIITKYVNKVYHINMIIEFITPQQTLKHKIRLIITKDGISRIELVH